MSSISRASVAIVLLCAVALQSLPAAESGIWDALEKARSQAGQGAYAGAAKVLGDNLGLVEASGRQRLLAQWRSWMAEAGAMAALSTKLGAKRPGDERALLERAGLVAVDFGDSEAALFLLAKQSMVVQGDAAQPLRSLDLPRLVSLIRWYDAFRSETGGLNLRWKQHAALTELQDRVRCGDAEVAGFDAKAQDAEKELEKAGFLVPLVGPMYVSDLVDGGPSTWECGPAGLRNPAGSATLPFTQVLDGSFEIRVGVRLSAGATCRFDLPLGGLRVVSLAISKAGAVLEYTGGGTVARMPVGGLDRDSRIEVAISAVKSKTGMQLLWKGGTLDVRSDSPLGEVDLRSPGIVAQGEVTIEDCRVRRLGGSEFGAPRTFRRISIGQWGNQNPAAATMWRTGSQGTFNPCVIVPGEGYFGIQADAGGKDKAAAMLSSPSIRPETRLASVLVTNMGTRATTFSVALLTSQEKNNWYETALVDLPPNAQRRILIDLKSRSFRTQANNWQPRAIIPADQGISKMAILVYNRNAEAHVRIDDVTIGD